MCNGMFQTDESMAMRNSLVGENRDKSEVDMFLLVFFLCSNS